MLGQRQIFTYLFSTCIQYVFTNITYPAYAPGCGLMDGQDMLEVKGTLNVTNTAYFNPSISIQAGLQSLCNVDLTKCGPTDVPTSGKVCVCLRNKSHSYDFFVRQEARSSLSNKQLEAYYQCSDAFSCDAIVEVLGKLPPIYEAAAHRYRMLGCHGREGCKAEFKQLSLESPTTTALEKQYVVFEYCTHHLIDVRVKIDDLTVHRNCAQRVIMIREKGSVLELNLAYEEIGVCQRKGSFTFRIEAVSESDRNACEAFD